MEKKPNRLIHEKSPYLLQHAYNPVDWYAWGKEVFEKAQEEDKPVFLSIGYSTCHWCHVMAHESFEDPEVAALMNDTFFSIKVDREERPDLDSIYMTVCQMLTGSGGWPLTIIMTPQKEPFFAGTYIPKATRFGRIGMVDLIPRIRSAWSRKRNEVMESAGRIIEALQGIQSTAPGPDLDRHVLDKAYDDLSRRFDPEQGGFGCAPKFPTPHNLSFALRYWKRTGEPSALHMVETTLSRMRRGGIYDHIGFGFHRYSTDREWLVPHFEKMLYDQAMLATAYVETFQATGKRKYGDTAKEIFTYVLRDMTSPEGGFYSAEDADSEGVEGKFYTWRESEIRSVLDKDEADLFIRIYGIQEEGNFREEATGEKTGVNIPHLKKSIPEIANDLGLPVSGTKEKVYSIRKALFDHRERRVRPHKDDKILTDWNGLMIAALARGGGILDRKEYGEAAAAAADFILGRMRLDDGRLLHRYRDGTGGIAANLDDYVFMIWGLIELYETLFDPKYLKIAMELNQTVMSRFRDEERGGLFFTPDDGEGLIVRKKEIYDGAVPSGNSVAMWNLLRLARFTGRSDLEEKAYEIGHAFSAQVWEHPSAHTQLMMAVDFGIGPSYEIVIVGEPEGTDTRAMLSALRGRFMPNKVVLLYSMKKGPSDLDDLAKFVKGYDRIDDKATAYVCMDRACKSPTTEAERMLEYITP